MREYKRIVCIIQARMGSKRLPRKSLMPLGGKPLVQNILERVMLAELIDEVVLATTNLKEDDVLIDLARKVGVSVFRGHPTDLVDRYYHAAKEYKADVIVRIPADNPLVHPREIDRIIQYYLDNPDVEFASNLGPLYNNGYPDGLGAEVFGSQLLEKLLKITDSQHRQDTVPSYVFKYPDKFRVGSVKCPKEFSRPDIVLDINTKRHYDFIAQMYQDLSRPGKLIEIKDIIDWYDSTSMKRE